MYVRDMIAQQKKKDAKRKRGVKDATIKMKQKRKKTKTRGREFEQIKVVFIHLSMYYKSILLSVYVCVCCKV